MMRDCNNVLKAIFVTVCLVVGSCHAATEDSCDLAMVFERYFVDTDVNLSAPVSISEIERLEIVEIEDDGVESALPFGRLHSEWREILGMHRPGDCLVPFQTSEESWESLAGRAGYFLVRGDEIIAVIYTHVS